MLFCTFLTARLQRETFNWDIIVEDVNTDFFCSFFYTLTCFLKIQLQEILPLFDYMRVNQLKPPP